MELLSLHIPKTAGTSFRNILKSVYGEDSVFRIDINEEGEVRINEHFYFENHLPKARVIHGHFVMKMIKEKFTIPGDCKIITWVREPVERVISNYYYLESRLQELVKMEKRNMKILNRMQKTLIEYSRLELNRNRQSKFLNGTKLEDFDFVGIQEYFDQDLARLAHILKWKKTPEILHQNKTPSHRSTITQDVIDEIRELNLEDIELYKKALQLRSNLLNN